MKQMSTDLHRFGADLIVGPSARGELMSVVNAAGLVLDGIAFCPPSPRLVVVHIHGSLGNFYQQTFLRVFANRLVRDDVALLCFNLTAHDGIAEGYTAEGDMQYIGGSLVRFASCLDDLDALVSLARSISPHVILQGHSLGCDRVLFYTKHRSAPLPLILLSPCNSYRLQELWLGEEKLLAQIRRLSDIPEGAGDVELVAAAEYGVTGPDGWTYSIPINREALLSILTGPPFDILRVDPAVQVLSRAPAFVYMGADDAIRGATLEEMDSHVRRLIPTAEVLKLAGDHSLSGCDHEVVDHIVAWAYSEGLLNRA